MRDGRRRSARDRRQLLRTTPMERRRLEGGVRADRVAKHQGQRTALRSAHPSVERPTETMTTCGPGCRRDGRRPYALACRRARRPGLVITIPALVAAPLCGELAALPRDVESARRFAPIPRRRPALGNERRERALRCGVGLVCAARGRRVRPRLQRLAARARSVAAGRPAGGPYRDEACRLGDHLVAGLEIHVVAKHPEMPLGRRTDGSDCRALGPSAFATGTSSDKTPSAKRSVASEKSFTGSLAHDLVAMARRAHGLAACDPAVTPDACGLEAGAAIR